MLETLDESSAPLLEARLGGLNERFRNFFAWYSARLIRKNFSAVRLTPGSFDAAEQADRSTAPLLMVMNHSSWWDPLLALVLGARLMPHRRGIAPMDLEQLRKFSFFRRIGIFGIDPDDPRSIDVLTDYAQRYIRSGSHARPSIIVTPQGVFTDVREPIVLRPGAAAILARLLRSPGLTAPAVLALNVEYGFWQDKRPEVFVRLAFTRLEAPPEGASETRTILRLNRALSDLLQSGADDLASAVRSRDPARFRLLFDRAGPAVNPAFDALSRLRGQRPEINSNRAAESSIRSRPDAANRGGASDRIPTN